MTSAQASAASNIPPPVALVTGAGRRLGRALALDLAAHGYRVVLHAHESLDGARQAEGQIAAAGGEAIVAAADLRDEAQVVALVEQARSAFGRLDALVNNAAIWRRRPLEQVTAAEVRAHFELNALGTFLCCQRVGLAMVEQPSGGAIVNVGDWAIARPYRDYSAYFAAKGAIPTLTRTFAVELGQRNPRVRVNAVLPGPVLWPEGLAEGERAAIVASTLAQREGTPAHVAHAVRFLLQNEFVTGVCIPVDGGRSVFAGDAPR